MMTVKTHRPLGQGGPLRHKYTPAVCFEQGQGGMQQHFP